MFGGSLRDKILLVMILVGLLPLVAAGSLAIYSLNVFHDFDLASIQDNLILQKVEEVQSFINDISASFKLKIDYLSGDPVQIEGDGGVKYPAPISLSSQRFLLSQLMIEKPQLEEVSIIAVFPYREADMNFSTGSETARYGRFYPDGVSGRELQDQNRSEKYIAAAAGQDYIGPIYHTLKGPMMTMASPIRNKDEEIIGVLSGEVNLLEFRNMAARSKLGNSGYVYMVDQDGFLIARGRLADVSPDDVKKGGFVSELILGKSFLGIDGQSRYKSIWGERVVAAGDYLEKLNIGIIAEWQEAEADAIVNTVRNQILIISLIVLIATILFSLFAANRIVNPIRMLEVGTRFVAQGKFDRPINIKTNDEIEELGAAFNKMMLGLKQLQELKEEFVFIAAHELRTPVTAIKGYISLILDGIAGPVSGSLREILDKIQNANKRLINLVNDLLEVARSEAGRMTIQVAPTNIIAPIKDVLSELRPLAYEKSITMIYEPDSGLPSVLADAGRVKEIMVNLVGNAIKYTVGSGTVTVRHEIQGSELTTHIQDTGVGMPKDAQKKLFEKFYRIQTEKTRDITGTGLGLFIVRQLVEKMNGRIWVESEEGKGSIFSFSLLLAEKNISQ